LHVFHLRVAGRETHETVCIFRKRYRSVSATAGIVFLILQATVKICFIILSEFISYFEKCIFSIKSVFAFHGFYRLRNGMKRDKLKTASGNPAQDTALKNLVTLSIERM